MYQVVTTTKTLASDCKLNEAMRVAVDAAKRHSYVEVQKIVSRNPWYAKSIKIFAKR